MVQQTPQSSTWWSWSQRWASKGINIKYEIRDNRNGYKSGALKEGMKRSYVKSCDYVAIFDADFQPDFLRRTIPFLVHNPDLALVQTRWKFDAARECGGLPLGIVALAESLKGVHELHKWKITLKRLKESNFWEMEDQILRLSNDCSDDATKQCFVYCALFDESQKIERWELIESFIEEGIIKEFDKGHSILDSLENVCLLERVDDGYDA